MKVLIVSDTHGRDSGIEEAVEKEAPFDMLVHCGDVEGREFFIEALADVPCCMVYGNNDFYTNLPREAIIEIAGKRCLVTHGHYYGISCGFEHLISAAKSQSCEMVMFGHIHTPVLKEENGVLLINPGSLALPRQSGHKKSYAVLTTDGHGNIHTEIKFL